MGSQESKVESSSGAAVLLHVYEAKDSTPKVPGFGIYHSGLEVYGVGLSSQNATSTHN